MKILITGATGFIGSALTKELLKQGHEIHALSRNPKSAKTKLGSKVHIVQGDLENALPDLSRLGHLDAVVHLAGESVASGRWNERIKQHILKSRELGTQNLIDAVKKLKTPPRVMISASGVGFYGSRGDEPLTETSHQGRGFLADVCRVWEAPLQTVGPQTRKVILRFGVVLGRHGGMLEKLLPVFKAGGGGKVGSGKQWMSWIHLDDVTRLILLALMDSRYEGTINAVAPEPVTNAVFTHQMGSVLHRPTLFAVPEFVLKLALGEVADEMILASQRVEPTRLRELKFEYAFPSLESALREVAQA